MLRSDLLKNSVITKCAELAVDNSNGVTFDECVKEYQEQFEDGSFTIWLRTWIGSMIEQGSEKAVSIMKDLISYGLAMMAERKGL